ncbi:MAG: hypothetical protein AAGA67_08480, partial [Cyanobacteria bacterium P01_F01_bin.153]
GSMTSTITQDRSVQMIESLLGVTIAPRQRRDFSSSHCFTLHHGPLLRSRDISVYAEERLDQWRSLGPDEYRIEDDGTVEIAAHGLSYEINYWTGFDLDATAPSPAALRILQVARCLDEYVNDPDAIGILSRSIAGEYSVTNDLPTLGVRDRVALAKLKGLGPLFTPGLSTSSYLLDRTARERAQMFGNSIDPSQLGSLLHFAAIADTTPSPAEDIATDLRLESQAAETQVTPRSLSAIARVFSSIALPAVISESVGTVFELWARFNVLPTEAIGTTARLDSGAVAEPAIPATVSKVYRLASSLTFSTEPVASIATIFRAVVVERGPNEQAHTLAVLSSQITPVAVAVDELATSIAVDSAITPAVVSVQSLASVFSLAQESTSNVRREVDNTLRIDSLIAPAAPVVETLATVAIAESQVTASSLTPNTTATAAILASAVELPTVDVATISSALTLSSGANGGIANSVGLSVTVNHEPLSRRSSSFVENAVTVGYFPNTRRSVAIAPSEVTVDHVPSTRTSGFSAFIAVTVDHAPRTQAQRRSAALVYYLAPTRGMDLTLWEAELIGARSPSIGLAAMQLTGFVIGAGGTAAAAPSPSPGPSPSPSPSPSPTPSPAPTPGDRLSAELMYYTAIYGGARINLWEAEIAGSLSTSVEEATLWLRRNRLYPLASRSRRRL